MKKIGFLTTLVLCLSLVIITSCKKDDDAESEVITNLLTANAWTEESVTFAEDGIDETAFYTDYFGELSSNFLSNGTYSVNSENFGAISAGNWVINEDHTTLTLTESGEGATVYIMTIVSISNTSLHLTYNYSRDFGMAHYNIDVDVTMIPIAE